ncbi:LPP20 family lipoprotein [Oceanospirillum maris]|uniref:LPP20 family lipoprotein n=1 Tax=Oceanospirillum maris TaxID=64977 RepID=UPI000488B41F|nr:LPP20 family lipoprotein [Oceanospirillum maris]
MAFTTQNVRKKSSVMSWLLAAAVLTGCSSAPTRQAGEAPTWVDQLPQQAGYVYGVGSADNTGSESDAKENAKERARADLIRQMEVMISSDFTSETQLQMIGGVTSRFVEQVNDKVRSQIPDVELPDLRWTDSWVNPETRTHYALAELNRRAAEAKLAEQLSSLDLELLDQQLPATKMADGTPVSRIDQVREAVPVLAMFAKRDKIVRQLQFVAESGFSRFALDSDLVDLRKKLNALVGALKITLSPSNAAAKALDATIAEEMTKLGLRLSTAGDADADLRLTYTLGINRKDVNRTHYVFARSAVQIRDSDNRIIGAFDREAKGVSGLEDRAKHLAVRRLGSILAGEVIDALFVVE